MLILLRLDPIFCQKLEKSAILYQNYTLFVVLLHNIQLQSDSKAQPIGYLIRRKLCQSQ